MRKTYNHKISNAACCFRLIGTSGPAAGMVWDFASGAAGHSTTLANSLKNAPKDTVVNAFDIQLPAMTTGDWELVIYYLATTDVTTSTEANVVTPVFVDNNRNILVGTEEISGIAAR